MKYELAKKLKDAGFPQVISKGDAYIGKYLYENGELEGLVTNMDRSKVEEIFVYVPTLSELIEACGQSGSIDCNIRINDGRYFVRFPGSDDGHHNELEYWLPTLEEVFAYHWLELNKK